MTQLGCVPPSPVPPSPLVLALVKFQSADELPPWGYVRWSWQRRIDATFWVLGPQSPVTQSVPHAIDSLHHNSHAGDHKYFQDIRWNKTVSLEMWNGRPARSIIHEIIFLVEFWSNFDHGHQTSPNYLLYLFISQVRTMRTIIDYLT